MLATGRVASTAASRAEVAAVGLILPAAVPVVDVVPADAVLVCAAADLGHFLASTNQFGRCARCSAPIMWRPHAAGARTKVCIPCAVSDPEFAS